MSWEVCGQRFAPVGPELSLVTVVNEILAPFVFHREADSLRVRLRFPGDADEREVNIRDDGRCVVYHRPGRKALFELMVTVARAARHVLYAPSTDFPILMSEDDRPYLPQDDNYFRAARVLAPDEDLLTVWELVSG